MQKIITLLCFVLGFVSIFALGLAYGSDDKCAAYYNYHSKTKMAYIKKLHPYAIIGNEEMAPIVNHRILPTVPFYIRIEDCEDIDQPSEVLLNKPLPKSAPVVADKPESEPKKDNTLKKLIAEILKD